MDGKEHEKCVQNFDPKTLRKDISSRMGPVPGLCEHKNEEYGSMKCEDLIWLSE
jgi:hypothetical protein